jgi:8-oxo-dGTP pyrophosphatase MutT (NUDIX family)
VVTDTAVEFFPSSTLRLVEGQVPELSPAERVAIDRFWEEAVAKQPTLFDGPAVACLRLQEQDTDLILSWARVTYRYRALRRVEGCTWVPSSVFVTVLVPTDDHGLVVGRSARSTAAAGRWGLPGGSAEPPADDEPFDLKALRQHAALELAEEVGVSAAPQELTLWGVTRGEFGNVGLHLLGPTVPFPLVLKHHEAVSRAEAQRGVDPELDQLAVVRSVQGVEALGSHADYLPQLVSRFAEQH